ncbi:MAG: hypothetical protein AAGC57_16905 [Pseudomonadota bacterium]
MHDKTAEALDLIQQLQDRVDELSKTMADFARQMSEHEKKQNAYIMQEFAAMEKRSVERHNQQAEEMNAIIDWVKKSLDS